MLVSCVGGMTKLTVFKKIEFYRHGKAPKTSRLPPPPHITNSLQSLLKTKRQSKVKAKCQLKSPRPSILVHK